MRANETDFSSTGHQITLAGRFLDAAHVFNQVYTPLLCIFGTLGNCVSVTVFCRTTTHRSLSASFYLSALAISDTGFLMNLGAVWLEDMGVRVITSKVTCPLVMYLGQVTCFLSVWFIVAFTMERYFAVCHPLTRPTICTVARAKKVIGILTTVALVGFAYVWVIAAVVDFPLDSTGSIASGTPSVAEDSEIFPLVIAYNHTHGHHTDLLQPITHAPWAEPPATTATTDGRAPLSDPNVGVGGNSTSVPASLDYVSYCTVRPQHLNFSSIANHIDSFLTLLLPFGIISYLNVRIALCVWRLKDQRENLVAMAKLTGSNSAASSTTTLNQVGFVYRSNSGHNHQPGQQDQDAKAKSPSSRRLLSPNMNHSGGGSHAPYHHFKESTHSHSRESRTNLAVEFEPSECSSSSLSGSRCCAQFNTKPIQYRCSGRKNTKSNSANGVRRVASVSHNAAETRVTKTLLLVSTVFLVLNLPSHAVRAATFMQSFLKVDGIQQEPLFAAQQWANILFNMNFSVNFLLYCVSGRNFRMSVKNIFCSSFPFNLGHKRKGPRILKPKRSCSPNPRLSPSLDSRHGDMYYPVSVTEVETYA